MSVTSDLLISAERTAAGEKSYRTVNPAIGESLEPAFAFPGVAEVEKACARPGKHSTSTAKRLSRSGRAS